MKSDIIDNLNEATSNPLAIAIAVGVFVLVCCLVFVLLRWALKRRGVLNLYARVLRYVWRYKAALAVTVIFSIAIAALSAGMVVLGEPFINQVIVDAEHRNLATANQLVIAVAALGIGLGISNFLRTYFHQYILGRVYVDIRTDTADSLLGLSLDFYDKRKTGGLLARLTNDVLVTQKSVDFMLGDIIEHPFMILALMGVIFLASWQMGLIVIIGLPIIVLPLRVLGKKIRKYSKKSLKRQESATQTIYQAFSGIRIVKAFGMEQEEKKEFRRDNERYFRKFLGVVRSKATSDFVTTFATRAIGVAALTALACYLLYNNLWGLNGGKILVIAGCAMLSSQPVRAMVKAYNKLQESMAGAGRVFELMDMKPTIKDAPDAKDLPRFQNNIVFDNVTFAYDEEPVLKGLNLSVKPGEMVAVVGPSGAGKTTLLNLAPRFYDPQKGAVLIDGHDLRNVKIKSILDQIAVVTQDAFLFHSSIRDNIRYGKRDATEEEIIAAAQAANAHDFIVNELPEGYDTVVGERGVRISGGQKQRITIARALLKNPTILLLDEATSSLDSESERLVQEALNRLMKSRTTLVIAHRLSTVMHADKIVVLDRGEMVGLGTSNELLKSCPQYQKLYRSQFRHTTTRQFTP